MENNFKSGFVSLVGKTNVGKSTLLNSLVKEKVAITTIKAIINNENYQIIITDTPGIHNPKTKLGLTMIDTAYSVFSDVDLILFLIEAKNFEIDKNNEEILEKIKLSGKPCILVINKIDLIKKEKLIKIIDLYSKKFAFNAVVPVSAINGRGNDILIEEILKILPNGPKFYDEGEYTDQNLRQISEEIIREKALKLLDDEIPHGIYVEVEKFSFRKTMKKEKICDIKATLYCIRESHKGIIIGKDGNMLKKISTYARQDMEKMLGTKVNLQVWVKVKEDWQNKESILKKFKK